MYFRIQETKHNQIKVQLQPKGGSHSILAMYSDGLNIQYFQDLGATWRLEFEFEFEFAEISGLLAKRASLEE
jgi:hypothetical protein